jgi:general secretion pathway protein A
VYLNYYGLIEQPFGVTPDPRFLYFGPRHREALASLNYGTESNRGFIALIAKPGMGKTSLLFQYLEGLRGKARTAFVFQTDCNRLELLRHILSDLGLDATGKDLPAMHEMFNTLLLEEKRAGRGFVLVIDEAQNLEEKALESVRLLSNFETPWMKLMQIVIAGQPQLAERLARPSLAQLRQRISMVVRIEPFTREETDDYIGHRLSVGGYKGQSPFTAGARSMIYEHSEGIPRNINNICFSAMSLACALKQKSIDQEILREVFADLDLGPLNGEEVVAPKTEERPRYRVTDFSSEEKRKSISHSWVPGFVAAAILLFVLSWPVKDSSTRQRQGAVGSQAGIPLVASTTTRVPSIMDRADGSSIRPDATPVQESVALTKHQEPQPDAPVETLDGPRSVKILPGQTLYRVVINNVGSYNDEILRELRELNPWLVDPSDVEAGQMIVMPSARKLSAHKLSVVSQGLDSKPAGLEKQ